MQLPLNESAYATLDGSGDGMVRLGPYGPNEVWMPTVASVKCSSNIAEASCKIYVGQSDSDDNYVDGTLAGSTGDSTQNIAGYLIGMRQSRYVFAVWSGGDSGAQATLNLVGTKDLR